MALPKTIAVHDLAAPRNGTARDVWAAVKRGEARLVWRDAVVTGIRFDRIRSQFLLTVDDTTSIPASAGTVLTIERIPS